jgi:hypothetical protein
LAAFLTVLFGYMPHSWASLITVTVIVLHFLGAKIVIILTSLISSIFIGQRFLLLGV